MNKEMNQFKTLKAMVAINLEEIPKDANIVKSKFVYKLKLLANGDIDKHKARLVAQGFTQVYGVDYFDNFSTTPLIGGVRQLIAFILHHKLNKVIADVSGAFLNANLRETIYLQLPPGIKFGGSQHARLLKSLYGIKQASRDWYLLQDEVIKAFDPELKRSKTDSCIYMKVTEDCIFIVSVHVDDYGKGYNNQKYFDDFIEH
jgi:hypothetical protein